ncbi:UDP-N-acetylglucosamine 2-epimerase (non-hydrolyzing) [Bradyrhizobium sp. BRP22]|uniref:non-hydrolyzing UDP-N-acetylglucosamine 2-epimerase n=1 Tax=Bradyrhizobium sp. BRP22 TaxID=2793821 RepID=UPI001CD2637B|nr:UDP-N-acetylglucosamine 2-epimerase (non-hydrolyzing) [Bradyrhizobium sp. BRP22]MCA1452082.1 UDP-N-acetylglucosamine 2-epimerase (non-hydrolyzing) [Bradyrhizobium sp. BRP22]
MKVMTLVGTRPELIKMSRVIAELDAQVDHVLVHSGQNYDFELNQVFFDELEIRKPDHFLGIDNRASPARAIADVIAKSDDVLNAERPEALLLYGDTNTCLAVIAAKRRKIPIFHMEAGNRCFDQRVPEELNRKVLDHLSDINLVLTEHARRYLLAEGIRPETIIKTGSHMREVLQHYMPKVRASDVLARLGLEERKFFLVSIHREENVDSAENLQEILETLKRLAEEYGHQVVVSTHPRTRKRLDALGPISQHSKVTFARPFGFIDYVRLQTAALCVLSDSGTITEEASLLNLPAITIRNAHERPEGMDVGTLIMSGLKARRVLEAVQIVIRQHRSTQPVFRTVPDYEVDAVSKQVVRVVLSYTDYINRTVWCKSN